MNDLLHGIVKKDQIVHHVRPGAGNRNNNINPAQNIGFSGDDSIGGGLGDGLSASRLQELPTSVTNVEDLSQGG